MVEIGTGLFGVLSDSVSEFREELSGRSVGRTSRPPFSSDPQCLDPLDLVGTSTETGVGRTPTSFSHCV